MMIEYVQHYCTVTVRGTKGYTVTCNVVDLTENQFSFTIKEA